MGMKDGEICEIQGLYGPFTLSERVLQKIWLRQDFALNGLSTDSGKSLVIRHPGRWNLHEGPDFIEADLAIDGRDVAGDVEIHFREEDWEQHGHGRNPNFNRVVLHVVLYGPDRRGAPAVRTERGTSPECFRLLPVLDADLEAYANDEALLEMERMDELDWVARFLEMPEHARFSLFEERTEERWKQKCEFARQRLESAGWTEACHRLCIEILGYSRNRPSMFRIARRFPLADGAGAFGDSEAAYLGESGNWKLGGVRPANHPRQRLRQYGRVLENRPEWPLQLEQALKELPWADGSLPTSGFRRQTRLNAFRRECSRAIFADQFGGTRLNTLFVDGFLPLAAAAGGEAEAAAMADYWRHWPPGDVPDVLRRFLKIAGIGGRGRPVGNGGVQAALTLFFRRGV